MVQPRRGWPTHRWTRLGLLGLVLAIGSPSPARAGEVVAVVNEGNPTPRLSLHQLRLLYGLYKRTWEGGIRVHLVLPLSESASMEFLVTRVLRMGYESELERFYLQAVFQQRIPKQPLQLSPEEALAAVRSDSGAIALVDLGDLDPPPGVRVLPIAEE